MAKAGPKMQVVGNDELPTRLVDATVHVLARDGFARTSARAVARHAGTVNGSIFYYFGSMDGLFAATAAAVAERGIERIRHGLGGDNAHAEWPARLGAVLRAEAQGEDGRAVMELLVGARTSPALAAQVRRALDHAIDYATVELRRVLGTSPVAQLAPVELIAEVAGAAFLGLEVMMQNGREIDLDRLVPILALGIQSLSDPTSRGATERR